MRNKLLHTAGMHTIGFIMDRSYKIDLYTVMLSAIDGKMSLLPVRVRHVENAQSWLPILLYTHLQRITFTAITFVDFYERVS